MLTLDTHIPKKQQVFIFSFLFIILGFFVVFGYQSYLDDKQIPLAEQKDATALSPATVSPIVVPTPPPTDKPTATTMISVTEASDEKPAQEQEGE